MKTIILPGFSPHNKDWAEEMAKNMDLGHEIFVHNWKHWNTRAENLSLKYEVDKILEEIGSDEVNILAKSVGTFVAAFVLPKIREKVKKVILCGIPSVSGERKLLFKNAFGGFPFQDIVCFQNTKDKFVPYIEVKKFLSSVNSKIKVIEKPRSDHDYPYPQDFEKFLKG